MATPHLIELDAAVSRIRQACDDSDNQPSPFFFVVGAGISCPSVPVARDIIAHCKAKASQYVHNEGSKSDNPIDNYSQWFERAYGDPKQRQKYLRKLIQDKQVTHANFRLAHLLLDNKISNIVVTTNFDDFLTKALTLFGKPHIVCDHPQMVGRINHTAPELQIVHLHGTYWFYDCCNLRDELQDRAEQSQQTTSTMAALLDMILWDRSPLIIGYSGWEGDVFMAALRRRIARPLGSSVYWFCFRRNQVDSIPDWLKHNPNVRFVVPPEETARISATDKPVQEFADTRSQPGEQTKAKGPSAGEDDVPSLPADKVLDKLILGFGLEAPGLTKDPLAFFAKRLDESLPKDEASDKDTDIYAIKKLIERIKRAQQREAEEALAATVDPWASAFEEIRDALRRADYRQAIQLSTNLPVSELSDDYLNELSEAAWLAALKLYDNSEEELAAYDLVVAISDRLLQLSPTLTLAMDQRVAQAMVNKGSTLGMLLRSAEELVAYDRVLQRYGHASDLEMQRILAEALLNKGVTLGELDRNDEELAVYDEMFQRYGDASDIGLRETVVKALFNKGVTLGTLNRNEEAANVYQDVVQRYGDAPEPGLRDMVARTLFNRGVTLRQLNRSEEALAVYDEVVKRYGEAPEPALQEQVAKSLSNKGFELGTGNRSEEELSAYDEVVKRFGDAPEPALREQVAMALFNKGFRLGTLNRGDEALAAYEEVVQRFGDAPETVVREHVAKALCNKGVHLGKLNRSEEALAVYNEVVQRFGDAPDAALRAQIAIALNGIGFEAILKAKAFRLKGDQTSAQQELEKARESLTAAAERDANDASILGNQAYLAFLSGRKDESLEKLRRAISMGGGKIKEAELGDADINRLPEDDEFCEMVRSIPAASPSEPGSPS